MTPSWPGMRCSVPMTIFAGAMMGSHRATGGLGGEHRRYVQARERFCGLDLQLREKNVGGRAGEGR